MPAGDVNLQGLFGQYNGLALGGYAGQLTGQQYIPPQPLVTGNYWSQLPGLGAQSLGQYQTTAGLGAQMAYQQTAWVQWAGSVTSGVTTTTQAWTIWAQNVANTNVVTYQQSAQRQPTAEELAEAARRQLEYAARRQLEYAAQEQRLRAELAEAEERAERLLDRHLTENQRKTWKKAKVIYLETARRRYRIHKGRTGNIRVVDKNDKAIQSWCVHPAEAVPDCDTVLAQILHLQNDEEGLERLANKSSQAPSYDTHPTERELLAA